MGAIDRYQAAGPVSRAERFAGRAISRVDVDSAVELARLDAAAQAQTAKVQAITHVAGRALQDVALLSQMEQQLSTVVPMASGRLAAITDLTALALTEVIAESTTKMRKL